VFLMHRYKVFSVHYVSPTEDNLRQTERMRELGLYDEVNTEVGHIIVAGVNAQRIKELLNPDRVELKKLIARG
jgi:isocitrate lyase